MNAPSIRDARPSDRDAIEAVTLAAYQEYAAAMPAAHWEAYRQNIVATLADVRPAAQLVALLHDRVVGAVLLYPAGADLGAAVALASPEVRLLAVAPAARNRGIGQALMRECVQRAGQSGAAELTLHTTDLMQSAMRMYERMGFHRAPELDFELGPEVTIKGYRLAVAEAAS